MPALVLSAKNWKIFSRWGAASKNKSKKPWVLFSLCCRAGIDAALVKADFFSAGVPTIENKIGQKIQNTKVASAKVAFDTVRLLEKGSFQKSPFSLEILENLEILEILENPQTLENKGESDHFLEILEDSREFRGGRDSRRSSSEKTPFRNDPFFRPREAPQDQSLLTLRAGKVTKQLRSWVLPSIGRVFVAMCGP